MKLPNWLIQARVTYEEVMAAAERAFRVEEHASRYSDLTQLENRVLLSATPVAVVAAPEGDVAQEDAAESESATEDASTEQTAAAADELRTVDDSLSQLDETTDHLLSVVDDQQTIREVVFVDESAADYEQLLADLTADREDGRLFEVVTLDGSRDGIEQITEVLSGRSDLDAIHFVSHGTDGAVKLGNVWLNSSNIDAYADQLVGWADALSVDADLLFYGCDLAGNELLFYGSDLVTTDHGPDFLAAVSALTGADAAAGTEYNGSAILYGERSSSTVRHELVILDSDVQNSAELRDLLLAQKADGRDLEFFILDSERDGIEQIAGILARYQDLDAVHVLSHGTAQGVQLGSTWLDAQTISDYSEAIRGWQGAFGGDADLLLYGCDLAASDAGRSLVDTLGQWTETDVAASTDLTGYALFGGDWQLEYQTGHLETRVVASDQTQADWQGLMAVSLNGTSSAITSSAATSLTWSHTINSGSNRVLTVSMTFDGNKTSTGVTYDGTALTLVGRHVSVKHTVEIWRLVAPTEGTANIVATFSSSTHANGGGVAFNGVDQTTPTGALQAAAGTNSTPSITIGSATGEMVIDTVITDNASTLTTGANQTEQYNEHNAGMDRVSAGSIEAGAASVTMSWSGAADDWTIGAVALKASASNVEEVLATNTGTTVNEASTGNVLTTAMLETTDVDNTAAQLTYTVTTATGNGTLRLSGTALGVSDTFTQADIDGGLVTYDHNGSETLSDSFDFSVDDGAGTSSSGTFNFTVTAVNDEEVVATNTGTTVNEASSGNVLTTAMLETTDADNTAAQLTYTVTTATGNGTLRLSGTALGVSDTFTQADIDGGLITYDHDGGETVSDSFDFDVDDAAGTNSSGTFNVTVNPVNDEEVLATNTGTTVNEASTGNVLTTAMLETTDVDNTAAQLTYTVTTATGNGTLRLSGTALGVSDTFTQADIDGGLVTYDHNGSETLSDSFDFNVDDGAGTSSSGTFNFTVTAVNDEEVVATNTGTTVNEASSGNVLTTAMLETTDADNTAAQLTYTVTTATGNGTLRLSGTALGVSDTFTQADIDGGLITYDHDGGETVSDSFDFDVDDAAGTNSSGTFNVTVNPVNDEEVLATNTGTTVNEASTGNVLTTAMLETTDVDNTAAQLTYTVTTATGNGTLRLSGTALGVSDTFTQADIDGGLVTYDHNGSETLSDSFDFSVDDGAGTSSSGTFNFTVTAVNDEEVVATNTGTTVNEASSGNVLTTAMLETTDADNTAAQLTYTVTTATGNGTLRLSGTALGVSDTFTQADIDGGLITYDHDGGETVSDSFDFDVDDAAGTNSSGTFNVTVNPVNDEEVLATNTGTTVNEASTGNVLTTAMLETTDVDNTAAQLTYTVTTATGNGTLRLSGTALGVSDTFTQADIDGGLVTYDHNGSETLSDSFDFSVDDGAGTSSSGTFNFTVTAVNDEEVVATNTGTTVNEASSGNVLTTAMLETTDADNTAAQLTYTVTTATGNGTLRLSGTALGVSDTFTQADIDGGLITYDHDGGETVSDSFDFDVDDAAGTNSSGTFNVTVNPVNDEEVLATNTGTTVNEASTGNVLTTAMLETTDVDNTAAQLTYTVTTATGNGTLRLSGTALGVSDTFTQADIDGGLVTYDHNGSETLSDSFDFSVDDGAGTSSSGTFNFTVTAVNDEEVVATNTGTTVNEASSGNVLTTAMLETTDADNTAAQLTYTVTTATGNGTLRLSGTALGVSDTFTQADIDGGLITYDHDGGETVSDSFDFDVDDAAGTNSSGTFNVTVNPVNDEEVLATNTGTTVNEASTGNVLTTAMLETTDVDNTAAQLTYTVTTATGNGTLRLSGTALGVSDTFTQADIDGGLVTYDHNGSETLSDSFDFSVDDGAGTSSSGTFNFTVTAVNDEEVVATNTGTTVNEASSGNVLTTAMLETTDADNTAAQLTYTVTTATGNGTLRLSGTALGVSDTFTQADIDGGLITYDHDGGETVSDSFDFDVDDAAGTNSSGTFNVTVNPVNDEEVLATNTGTTVNEASTGNVLTTAMLETTDVDNTAAQLTYTVTTATGNGTLRLSGTALGVSDTFTQADIDGGLVTYDHNGSETLSDSFDFSVDDGAGTSSSGTFNFTVTAVNDEEVVATNTGTTVNEASSGNVLTTAMLETTDADNTAAQLTYTVTTATGNGTLRLSGTALGVSDTFTQADIDGGLITYDHDGGETVSDSFDFDVDDAAGTNSSGTFNVTVNPVNDEEVLATNTGTTVNEASTGNVLTTAMLETTDVDNTAAQLTYTVTTATGNGTLRLSGTALGVSDTFTQADIDGGLVTYDHNGSETLSDSFDFNVDDGAGTSSSGTFNFTVTAVNDEEVVATNTGTTVNEASSGNVLTTAMLETTDADNTAAQLTYTVTTATGNGTLRLSGTALGVSDTFTQADIDGGLITYDHDGGETVSDSFDFDVDDAAGTNSSGTFNVTVNPVNDEEVLATNTGTTVNEASTGNVLTTAMLETTDVDNTAAQLTYTVTTATGNGTLRLSGTALGVSDTFTQADIDGGLVTYDHNGSETLSDSFDFSVDDGAGTSSSGTFNFTVTAVNDEEVVATNTGTTVNEASSGNVLTTAMLETTDADNTAAQLTYTVTTATGNGTLRLSGTALGVSDTFTQADIDGGLITYDHDGGETVSDSFDFDVDDAAGTNSSGTFNVTVNPVNDDPTNIGSLPTDVSVTEDISSNIDLSAIDLSDVDHNGGVLTLSLNTGGEGLLTATAGVGVTVGGSGTASITFNGTLVDLNSYLNTPTNIQYLQTTANLNGNDIDFISITINDNGNFGIGGGVPNYLGTVNIDILSVNDIPIAISDNYSTTASETLSIFSPGLLANDTDVETATLSVSLVGGPSVGELTTNPDGSFSYTAPVAFYGETTFSYRVSDGTDWSNIATVTIDVTSAGGSPAPTTEDSATAPASESASDTEDDEEEVVLVVKPAEQQQERVFNEERRRAPAIQTESAPGFPVALFENFSDEVLPQEGRLPTYVNSSLAPEGVETINSIIMPTVRTQQSHDYKFLWTKLDTIADHLTQDYANSQFIAGTAMVLTSTAIAGYAFWTMRAGYALAWLTSSIPVWAQFDPLPILNSAAKQEDGDGESLLDIPTSGVARGN